MSEPQKSVRRCVRDQQHDENLQSDTARQPIPAVMVISLTLPAGMTQLPSWAFLPASSICRPPFLTAYLWKVPSSVPQSYTSWMPLLRMLWPLALGVTFKPCCPLPSLMKMRLACLSTALSCSLQAS